MLQNDECVISIYEILLHWVSLAVSWKLTLPGVKLKKAVKIKFRLMLNWAIKLIWHFNNPVYMS